MQNTTQEVKITLFHDKWCKSSLRKRYGRHHDLVDRYGIYVLQMTTDMILLS